MKAAESTSPITMFFLTALSDWFEKVRRLRRRRGRLPDQALPPRRADRAYADPRRAAPNESRGEGRRPMRGSPQTSSSLASSPRCRPHRPGRGHRRDRAHPRRDRAPARSSSRARSTRRAPRRDGRSSPSTARRSPRDAPRERALRPRARRLHRRDRERARALRGRRRRHALPRRDRRDPARAAGEAPARAPGARGSSAVGDDGRSSVDVRVVAATNRDLRAQVAAGTLPRGPLLPPQRLPDRRAAAARAPPRTSRSSSSTSCDEARRASRPTLEAVPTAACGALRAPRLAGQRARARERDRALTLIMSGGTLLDGSDVFSTRETAREQPLVE